MSRISAASGPKVAHVWGVCLLLAGTWAYRDLKHDIADAAGSAAASAAAEPVGEHSVSAHAAGPASKPKALKFPPDDECQAVVSLESVRATTGRDGRAVFACFDRAKESEPELRVSIDLWLRVGEDGRVESAHVQGLDEPHRALAECILEHANKFTFARLPVGPCGWVNMPFLLGTPIPLAR